MKQPEVYSLASNRNGTLHVSSPHDIALHWFTLAEDRQIKCIRLFKDPSGWAAIYEEPPAHDVSVQTF